MQITLVQGLLIALLVFICAIDKHMETFMWFRPLLSPVVMAAVLQRISKNIEVITDHSLDIRRYYRKESY